MSSNILLAAIRPVDRRLHALRDYWDLPMIHGNDSRTTILARPDSCSCIKWGGTSVPLFPHRNFNRVPQVASAL